jgi:hypothetical protein
LARSVVIRCKVTIAAQRNNVRERAFYGTPTANNAVHRLADYSPALLKTPVLSSMPPCNDGFPTCPSGETGGAAVGCLIGKYFTLA